MALVRRRMAVNPYFGKTPTAQEKIKFVNERMGNKAIDKQQGTTRIIYDFISLATAPTLFEFFKDVNTKSFPFTNLQESRLQVGESIVVERMYLSVITVDPVTGDVTSSMELNQAGLSNLYRADLDFMIDNNRTIKPINVQSFQPQFNRRSMWGAITSPAAGTTALVGNAIFHCETLITIPSLISFQVNMRTDDYVAIANTFLGITLEGTGAILAPRQTY